MNKFHMHFNKSPYVVHTKINGNKEKGLGPHIVVVAHSATRNHIIQRKISNEIVSVSQTESPKSIITVNHILHKNVIIAIH